MISLIIDGMTCKHCVASVEKALQAVDPDARIEVALEGGLAKIDSTLARAQFVQAIDAIGFDVIG